MCEVFFLHRSTFLHRRFFLAAVDVPPLEDKFNVDQYSDLVTVTKPVIYISIGEIINTHTVRLNFTLALSFLSPPPLQVKVHMLKYVFLSISTSMFEASSDKHDALLLLSCQLLLDHQDAIAPEHNDPIHELLEDLGEVPTVESLIGAWNRKYDVVL